MDDINRTVPAIASSQSFIHRGYENGGIPETVVWRVGGICIL